MKLLKSVFPITFFLAIALMSCDNVTEHKIRNNWTPIRITYDWLIDVPKGFKLQEYPGIDSEVGSIYSKKDSINLEFESWRGIIGEGNYCESDNEKLRFNQKIKELKSRYASNEYEFIIEEINGLLALIVYPKNGSGDYRMEIHNCEVGSPLVLNGKGMENRKLIIDIFRTVRYNKGV